MDKIRVISITLTLLLGLSLSLISKQPPIQKASHYLESIKTILYAESFTNEAILNTKLRFISGELIIFPLTTPKLFSFQAEYKLPQNQPKIHFTTGKTALLSIDQNRYQHYRMSSKSNWALGLNTAVTHNISIESKIGKHTLDLSGLKINTLHLKEHAGQLNLVFNQPNPIYMKRFSIETSAADCQISGLGNANAQKILLKSNAGNFRLTLNGDQSTSSELIIWGRIGNAQLRLPPHLNTKIMVKHGILALNSIHGLRKISANTYISQNYSETKPVLKIWINLRSGKLKVEEFIHD